MKKALEDAGITSGKIGIINVNAATDSCVNREEGFRAAFDGTDFEIMETQSDHWLLWHVRGMHKLPDWNR